MTALIIEPELESYFSRTRHLWCGFLSQRYPLTLEMMKHNEAYLDWRLLSKNRAVHWSHEIIESFETRWDWMQLTRNRAVYRSIPDIEPLIIKYAHRWSWKHLWKHKRNLLTDKLLQLDQQRVIRYPETPSTNSYYALLSLRFPNAYADWLSIPYEQWRYIPWLFRRVPSWRRTEYLDFLNFLQQNSPQINWSVLSSFSGITLEMLEQFEEHWDWQVMSRNKSLTFSMQLLHQFRHRWEWPIHKIHDQAASMWPVDLPGSGFNPEKFPGFFKPDRSNAYQIRKPLNLEVLSTAVNDDMAWIMVNRLQATKIAWSFELYKHFEDKWLLDLMTVPRHVFNIKWSPGLIYFLLRQSSND